LLLQVMNFFYSPYLIYSMEGNELLRLFLHISYRLISTLNSKSLL